MHPSAARLRIVLAALLASFLVMAPAHGAEPRGTREEAQAMVAAAIAHYDAVGASAAFAKFTEDPAPEFRDRDLYVFVVREDGRIAAHGATPSRVGADSTIYIDPDGTNIGRAILDDATSAGAWVDYKRENPVTGGIERKSSWVALHDGLVFGVGVYRP